MCAGKLAILRRKSGTSGTLHKSYVSRGFGFVRDCHDILHESKLHTYIELKGTVSRDFSSLVFFHQTTSPVPIGMSRNNFESFRIFVELFAFKIDSPVMTTPGSRLESLRLGNFCKHKSHIPR